MLIVGGLTFGAYQYGQSSQKEISSSTTSQAVSPIISQSITVIPTPTMSPTPTTISDNDLIRKALFKKHNWPDNSTLVVNVKTNDGIYASGSVTDQGGGGYFFAAKVSGIWQIVADGNGVILCSDLTAYSNFPKSLIPECWDQATNKNIKR